MLFNSISFAIFLPIVFILYWFATKGNLKTVKTLLLLLLQVTFFYACWDWRFMFLLIFSSTFLDYFNRHKNTWGCRAERKRLLWLWLSITYQPRVSLEFSNTTIFFAASFAEGLSLLGLKSKFRLFASDLTCGNFFLYFCMDYHMFFDLYNNRIKPERNFVCYSVFVSFFPLLVAGPIERATHLLPQIPQKKGIRLFKSGWWIATNIVGLIQKDCHSWQLCRICKYNF